MVKKNDVLTTRPAERKENQPIAKSPPALLEQSTPGLASNPAGGLSCYPDLHDDHKAWKRAIQTPSMTCLRLEKDDHFRALCETFSAKNQITIVM